MRFASSNLVTDPAQISKDELKRAYLRMYRIRAFDERVEKECFAGTVPGFAHVYIGQEASAVGVCHDLSDKDYIGSTHRGHGHCIAKGVEIDGMMKEIMGKASGLCGGKGGSMHIADLKKGMLGANAIVGGTPPIAVGAALSLKTLGSDRVSVAFCGDGGANQGTTFEALNLSVVLKLPVIFALENNGYGEHTHVSYACGAESLAIRARGFGLPAETVDGQDFFAVHAAMGRALAHARGGKGPYVLETMCCRFSGHFIGDPQPYRTAKETADARARDPLIAFRKRVAEAGVLESADLDSIERAVLAEVEAAVVAAIAAPQPDLSMLEKDVYVSYP
jgi:pyruvate dehydrogenase E1 component alpha subunit